MRNKHISVRATSAFNDLSETDIQALPVLEAAFILNALPPLTALGAVRVRLAQRVRAALSLETIKHGDPAQAFLSLAALWRYQSSLVQGAELAAAIQRMVSAEATAGGPYRFDGTLSVLANACVAEFTSQVAKPLPNVTSFLRRCLEQPRRQVGTTRPLPPAILAYSLAHTGEAAAAANYCLRNLVAPEWQTALGQAAAAYVLHGRLLQT